MAVAVPLISCGKIADNMLKSECRDKNTTQGIISLIESVGSPTAPLWCK